MPLYLVDDKTDEPAAPADGQVPEHRTHPIARALVLTAGAFALLVGGFALGTARGQDLLRAWMPSIAATEDAPVLRQAQLDDGYDGKLAADVAEASAQVASAGVGSASLDEATAGAVDGLLRASGDSSATYLSPEEYERFVSAPSGAEASGEKQAASSRADSASAGADRSKASDAALVAGETLPEGASTGVVHGVGVIRVSELSGGTLSSGVSDAIAQAVERMAGAGATSFVLDLRGVFGSDMAEAVRVASLFLDGGTVARTHGSSDDVLQVISGMRVTDAPLAVLVDETTYGTPEVVAGALQDHLGALVVGRVSAGGAAMQEVRELSNGGALVLASAQVATPDDRTINGAGIAPDLVCAAGTKVSGAAALAQQDVQLASAVACAALWQSTGSMALSGLTNAPGPQDGAFNDEPSDVTSLLVEAGLATQATSSATADAAASSATDASAASDAAAPEETGEPAVATDAATADAAATDAATADATPDAGAADAAPAEEAA